MVGWQGNCWWYGLLLIFEYSWYFLLDWRTNTFHGYIYYIYIYWADTSMAARSRGVPPGRVGRTPGLLPAEQQSPAASRGVWPAVELAAGDFGGKQMAVPVGMVSAMQWLWQKEMGRCQLPKIVVSLRTRLIARRGSPEWQVVVAVPYFNQTLHHESMTWFIDVYIYICIYIRLMKFPFHQDTDFCQVCDSNRTIGLAQANLQ